MNSSSLNIAKNYLSDLVVRLSSGDVSEGIIPGAFRSDVNGTLDRLYKRAEGGYSCLLDFFLADVKKFGGYVELYTGRPDEDFSHLALSQAFEAAGQELVVIPKPDRGKIKPAILFEDEGFLRSDHDERPGAVGIHPDDEGFAEFLKAWHALGDTPEAQEAKSQMLDTIPGFRDYAVS